MITDKPMSEEESVKLGAQVYKLMQQGKKAEAMALERTIPILPEQAYEMKKFYGLEVLKSLDLNLSNAVVKYGPDFLTK
jgi:hypothetical protein